MFLQEDEESQHETLYTMDYWITRFVGYSIIITRFVGYAMDYWICWVYCGLLELFSQEDEELQHETVYTIDYWITRFVGYRVA